MIEFIERLLDFVVKYKWWGVFSLGAVAGFIWVLFKAGLRHGKEEKEKKSTPITEESLEEKVNQVLNEINLVKKDVEDIKKKQDDVSDKITEKHAEQRGLIKTMDDVISRVIDITIEMKSLVKILEKN